MHSQQHQSGGSAGQQPKQEPLISQTASSLPFGQELPLSSIGGPTYLTAQTLVQQVAYTLSDKVFAYSPETFGLDASLTKWRSGSEKNAFGYSTGVSSLETRAGAGSIALGYIFSEDFDVKKRHIPQAIVASSSSLHYLRGALDQLSLLYAVSNPLVTHIAAVDYSPASSSGLVTDYVSAFSIADDLGLGLISSASIYEAQHISLLSTLVASILPTIHIFDGVHVGRETTRVVDVLDQSGLSNNYNTILKQLSGSDNKGSDQEGRVIRLLQVFNDELGTDYKAFEYHGHTNAESVLVVFGSVEATISAQVISYLAKKDQKVGVVNVRLYRPFVEEEFLAVLPKSVKTIGVLGQVLDNVTVVDDTQHSRLYSDVLAAVNFAPSLAGISSILDLKYAREQVWTPSNISEVISKITATAESCSCSEILDPTIKQYTFWDLDNEQSIQAPFILGQILAGMSATNVSLRSGHDNLVQGGIIRTDIRTSSKSIEAPYPVEQADVTFVGEQKLFGEFDILKILKFRSSLIVRLPGVKDEDLEKKLPPSVRKALLSQEIQLFLLDPSASSKVAEDEMLGNSLAQLCFLKIARADLLSTALDKIATTNVSKDSLNSLVGELDQTLRHVTTLESWAAVDGEGETTVLPTDIHINSFSPFDKMESEPPTLLKNWVIAAKGIAFKEAYGTETSLRPDLGIKTFVAHVKEHRRLTPLTYDRNIFHIEFDLGDSGLTYAIGEALGIHAENDRTEIEEFIKWYGLNPDEIVEVPTREDPGILENRTVYQALLQNVDIFGRPPKRFYEALAEFASDPKEKQDLLTLCSADGATEFKRRAEVDTITFADVLLEFSSAHPSFHDIVRIVSPMKRREYSIASSQRVTPNSVSLLIVTVNWVDSKGRDRFGQATRYLNSLPVGTSVTVSVKPSVMKLPPKATAPIIMAGLGTGLAPFRAFVQERALQKQRGEKIGAVLLYMGSRHQREEYLYGEEWEAYQDAGIITLLGRAFSRDQPQKIYIQDRMRQTMDEIRQAYLKEEGSFYLCGPTWPVPDVTEVLQEALELEAKSAGKKMDSRRAIEQLKDDGRYVLEVY